MGEAYDDFRAVVGRLANQWAAGLPSRQALEEAAETLKCLRERLEINGIWGQPPSMVTATLDDGLGQGLAIIQKFAVALGMRVIALGLMQTPEAVIEGCRRHQPDFLGLTILQFDTEDDLACIASQLPRKTRIVAGGPVFSADPGFAGRTGTHFAANDVAGFLRCMLDRSNNQDI
jgi:methylmalonyl-CoA mutase cobalamin-binding subunit